MESLESILTDLQVKYTSPKSDQSDKSHQESQDLSKDSSKPAIATSPISSPSSSLRSLPNSSNHSLDQLLANLRNNSANKTTALEPVLEPEIAIDQLPSVVNHRINHDLQQVADRQKAKELEQFTQQADEWLKKLDPLSGEGLWFAEFAKNYPSRLEAAIALIAAK